METVRSGKMEELIIDHEGKLKHRIIDKVMNELKGSTIETYEKKKLKNGTCKITIYYE